MKTYTGFIQRLRSHVPRARPKDLLAISALIAVAGVAAMFAPTAARANYPTCAINHSDWALTNCSNSGVAMTTLCSLLNLRNGPGVDYDPHGAIGGEGWPRYKIVFRATAVNAGCGGPTSNQWNLSEEGWVSRSGTNV